MTVVFDAEPILAFGFDEPGADAVQQALEETYSGRVDAYLTTVTLAEVCYVARRRATADAADRLTRRLAEMGVRPYSVDDLWRSAAALKAEHAIALGDAFAVAAAAAIARDGDDDKPVRLIVGADDDFDGLDAAVPAGCSVTRIRGDGV